MRFVTAFLVVSVASLIVFSSGCVDDEPLLVDPIDIDPTGGVINYSVAGNTVYGADDYLRDDFAGVLREAVAHYEKNGTPKKSGNKNNMTISYDLDSGLRVEIRLKSKTAGLYINGFPAELTTCDPDLLSGQGACSGNGIPKKITGAFRGELRATYYKYVVFPVTRNATEIDLNPD